MSGEAGGLYACFTIKRLLLAWCGPGPALEWEGRESSKAPIIRGRFPWPRESKARTLIYHLSPVKQGIAARNAIAK